MLAYDCEQCKRISVVGFKNEYNQFFCSKGCYEIYCGVNGYEAHPKKLYPINEFSK